MLDSVADPFGGRKWWLEQEDPWQMLGVCFELKAAIGERMWLGQFWGEV